MTCGDDDDDDGYGPANGSGVRRNFGGGGRLRNSEAPGISNSDNVGTTTATEKKTVRMPREEEATEDCVLSTA